MVCVEETKTKLMKETAFFVCDESLTVKGQLIEVFVLDWKMVVSGDKKEGCGVGEGVKCS